MQRNLPALGLVIDWLDSIGLDAEPTDLPKLPSVLAGAKKKAPVSEMTRREYCARAGDFLLDYRDHLRRQNTVKSVELTCVSVQWVLRAHVLNSDVPKKVGTRLLAALLKFAEFWPLVVAERLNTENPERLLPLRDKNSQQWKLNHLPKGWILTFRLEASKSAPSTLAALCLMAVTGLRAIEVKTTRGWLEDKSVWLRIQTAKGNAQRQVQPWRELQFGIRDLVITGFSPLVEFIRRGGDFSQISERKIRRRTAEIAARLSLKSAAMMKPQFPTFKETFGQCVTPILFRHAFSARLKKNGYSPKLIAWALGHIQLETQVDYAPAEMGERCGGVPLPLCIRAPIKPRRSRKKKLVVCKGNRSEQSLPADDFLNGDSFKRERG